MLARQVRIGVSSSAFDEVIGDVYAYEIPIVVFNHGSLDKVRLIEDLGEFEIEDLEAEWDRLRRRWGRGPGGRHAVEQVFQGGFLTLAARIKDGDAVLDELKRLSPAREGKVQPRQGDPGYLDKKELSAMLKELTGNAASQSLRRNTLRAQVIMAVEEAYLSLNLKAPMMDTDPEVIAAYEGWVEAKTEAERAGG